MDATSKRFAVARMVESVATFGRLTADSELRVAAGSRLTLGMASTIVSTSAIISPFANAMWYC